MTLRLDYIVYNLSYRTYVRKKQNMSREKHEPDRMRR